MRLCSIVLIVHSLCLALTVAQGISLRMPGCPEKCGNIVVPYPFGIGSNCSANSWFTVTCQYDFNPPKPFLSRIDLEVREFSLDTNVVTVMQAVSPLKCSSSEKKMRLGKSIVGSPFFFSSNFAVVGCKTQVRLSIDPHTNSSSLGCRPTCGYTTLVCHGINCCRIYTSLLPRLQDLVLYYKTFEHGNDHGVCGLAFLVEYNWLTSDYKNYTSFQNHSYPLDMSLQYVPMRLGWEFIDKSIQTLQGVTCENVTTNYSAALDDSNYYPINTTRCRCDNGFEGDPYLPGGGCQDIDECGNTTLHNCTNGSKCINAMGSFTCHPVNNNQMKSIITGISSGTGALLWLSTAWMLSKVIRKRISASRKKKFFRRNGGLLLEQRLSSNDGGVEKIKLFNSKQLALATNRYNENRILGRGGQGTVYKGMLSDGRIVAVKKFKRLDAADIEVFINEVVILSQINHRDVVKLLGCCLETEIPLLVYEFISNGTLFQHIHDQNDEFPLSWKMRVRIATEVAGALSYLHNAASVPIYHRDIKSTNILLDDKYRAKLSDFGIARSIAIDQTHLTTKVLGTFGYLDPEYFWSSKFTEKSDVYSFGVVMVELLTGEKAVPMNRAEEGINLASYFLNAMEENNLLDILDPEVIKEGRTEEIVAIAKLARRCLNLKGKRRPTMKEVAAKLEGIHMLKEGTVFQYDYEDTKFHSIEPYEVDDISSISDSTSFDIIINAESSESPLPLINS